MTKGNCRYDAESTHKEACWRVCSKLAFGAIVTLTMVTIRWRTYNPEERQSILDDHDGFILVFWHSRIIAMPWLWPRRHAMNALQSPHPDGRLLAHTVNHLGVRTVWGSSNRNAMSGLRGLKRVLDVGKVAAITPDGPAGPARVAATGPVALANLTGKPIIPVAWSVDRFWRAPGWDAMLIPKPFCRGIRFGERRCRQMARRLVAEKMAASVPGTEWRASARSWRWHSMMSLIGPMGFSQMRKR